MAFSAGLQELPPLGKIREHAHPAQTEVFWVVAGQALARLDGAVVFDVAVVEAGAVVERSIVGFGARIGPRALVRDGVIGDGAVVGARCELLRGARLWPGVTLPDGGIRFSSDV